MRYVSLIDGHIDDYVGIHDAISHFKYGISHDIFKEPVTSYAKMAVEALEKQIPKIPNVWEDKYYFSPTPNDDWGYECPYCGSREIDYPDHHCTCGQALDWEYNWTICEERVD